ncbi:flavoprotein [Pseudovibrio sp. Tun.PSC04-5.I4]|uniref:flavoprotein n=1 Tax=Pseudovibrio sp. Tun.PSC04-5.I4 TaxID=1798213 RepID=UPI00088567D1|nr:flavoprotein [Pseudovibrio sp. Tun.PSC04-5.I4]SDQ33497.1 phosphopantothenoylcysteine decarboxylase / phosphopantothenate--cysteine ligase [Pseudovibrio sp. Tun.PSC04-5.I4]
MITNAPSVKARILVGATGSLDATLLPTYLREIKNSIDCSLTAMFTPNATKFVNMDSIALFVDRLICGDDPKDWATDKPGRIAAEHDILAIMPATANTLSAVANGSSLNRLTTVVLAAEFPVLLFPVMGGPMWKKASVKRNVTQIREDGYQVCDPVWRENYDPHMGKIHGHQSLPDPADVVAKIKNHLPQYQTRREPELSAS